MNEQKNDLIKPESEVKLKSIGKITFDKEIIENASGIEKFSGIQELGARITKIDGNSILLFAENANIEEVIQKVKLYLEGLNYTEKN